MPRQRSAVRYGTPLLLGTLMVLAALIALLHPLPARTANVAIAVKAPREVPQRAVESVDRTEGARQLAQRRLAVGDVSRVSFAVVDNATHEFVEWRLRNGAATITATSTSALCLGLARVFEQACGVTLLSWADASRPTKPCLATAADSHGRVSGLFRYRYAFNAVRGRFIRALTLQTEGRLRSATTFGAAKAIGSPCSTGWRSVASISRSRTWGLSPFSIARASACSAWMRRGRFSPQTRSLLGALAFLVLFYWQN